MDNASWAMDQLRAATESIQREATTTACPCVDIDVESRVDGPPTPYISQFRIDGQPILPPVMTPERRLQMQQLRAQATLLEAKYKQAKASNSTVLASSDGEAQSTDAEASTMNSSRRLSQLQQTKTYIYDSTAPAPIPAQARSRPPTLELDVNDIPTICVNPPTPQRPTPPPQALHVEMTGLDSPRRKINNITSRIMQFEGKQVSRTPEPANVVWHHKLRSSTSPQLNAAQLEGQQLQRSRSFTLDEPSQALKDHMQLVGQEQTDISSTLPATTAESSPAAQRCRSSTCWTSSSASSLAHLRRDTVESKAKQVQRSASSTSVDLRKSSRSTGRSCAGHQTRPNPQDSQQLKEIIQRALHEADIGLVDGQQQHGKQQLQLAKRQMFLDIMSAHRDRFQQLVQYQHEEQRRMQTEFDRQQKLLIEQICADINVSTYVSTPSPSRGISEYTSTDDMPTPTPNCSTPNSMQDSVPSAARKLIFAVNGETGKEVAANGEVVSMHSSTISAKTPNNNNNNSSTANKNLSYIVKKQQQQQQRKTTATPSPVLATKSPVAKRTTVVAKSNPRQPQTSMVSKQPQQQQDKSKDRKAASPRRQMTLPSTRERAATVINATARGYLVRRLFRTEQVQRIVRTIRDTLVFVLNLHMETYGKGSEEHDSPNLRLKARLLQQTSIKERMDIIARDRKRAKLKALAAHHVKHP